MTPPESPLIKSMANLRDSFAQRAHEIDAKQQQALLDALHQLYTSTQSLSNQLQSLVSEPAKPARAPRKLYLVK
jgi:hypothetical protein